MAAETAPLGPAAALVGIRSITSLGSLHFFSAPWAGFRARTAWLALVPAFWFGVFEEAAKFIGHNPSLRFLGIGIVRFRRSSSPVVRPFV